MFPHSKKKHVLVALSGGADSSAAAFLLREAGYEVSGLFMRLGDDYQASEAAARRVAESLGIAFHAVNLADRFESEVISYFISAYEAGETPNPCVHCNKQIKFGALLEWRERLGADYLATGHYVRSILNETTGEYELYQGADKNKDQSYFLYHLGQAALQQILFPLGDMQKTEIKALLQAKQIPFQSKESMDICFLMQDGKALSQNEYLAKKISLTTGPIKLVRTEKKDGKRITDTIGQHKGLPLYTIGQRRGVEIGGTGPYYVAGMSYTQATLYVVADFADELLMNEKIFSKDNRLVNSYLDKNPCECQAVIRYRHQPVPARLDAGGVRGEEKDTNLKVKNAIFVTSFDQPVRAAMSGQSIVWYQGERVIGGGVINEPDHFLKNLIML